MTKLTYLVIVIAIFGSVYFKINQVPDIPDLIENAWWGPGSPQNEDTTIRPFKINVPKELIDDLKSRLKNHKPFTPPLEGIQHQYGMNTNLLKQIINYWSNEYNWTEREKYLNQYSQFKTKIQGLGIHFLHVKPKNIPTGMKVLPILILHGWPGSVVEFYDAIPLLTTPRKEYNFVFEVIAPSLPGFAFSEGASKPGLSARQMGVIFNILMKRLGFNTYYIQGGDWGSIVGSNMAIHFPQNTKGVHLNMCYSNGLKTNLKWLLGSIYPSLVVRKEREHKMYPISKNIQRKLLGTGYLHIQATKPDTIGVAFSDSPSGLAAYILEKFISGTNLKYETRDDGGLGERIKIDKLLDNVMLYYITNSMTTAMRIYAESMNTKTNELQNVVPVKVPVACLSFMNEIVYQPKFFLTDKYTNLLQYTEYDDGGHFAAMELPKVFTDDVWKAMDKIIHLAK